jgi:hypothetical protein
MASSTDYGIEVIGPIKVDTTWQAQAGKGFAVSCFGIDWEQCQVTCPQGQVSRVWAHSRDKAGLPRIEVRFDKAAC